MENPKLGQPKQWLIEQLKAEELKNTGNYPTNRQWRLKDWLKRVSMAEFESTRLQYTSSVSKKDMYEELVAPIIEEIKEWNKN